MPIWKVGIDPGFGTTAIVLLKDDEPVACEANWYKSTPRVTLIQRTLAMSFWVYELLYQWIEEYKIEELAVLIETPILNRSERGVTTMMTQMRMLATYEAVLCDLPDSCEVRLGEVHNQTAKATFTGSGSADKSHMISCSVWAYRPDVEPREHLADAQAIGTVVPSTIVVNGGAIVAKDALYMDNAIGKGPKWKNKHPKTRR